MATGLGTLPGDCSSEAFAINSRGQVVGRSVACDSSTRSFLWESGSMIDLNAFVPPGSGVQLDNTFAFNDRGEIGPEGLPPSCTGDPQGNDSLCGHAFVLIPCDENHGDSECEDEGEAIVVAPQRNSAPVTRPADATQGRLTPEMLSELRARMARRYHFPGLVGPKF